MASTPDFQLSLARPVPAWRHKLAAFWRWWAGELAAMLPERFARGSRVPVLAMEDGDLVLVEPRSAAGPDARVAFGSLDTAQARMALRALLERAGETRGRARVCLARDEALVRRVAMPAATEENLTQVIGFEMDRLTPFRAEDVYFDQRVVSRDPAAGQIGVQLAVARRELVDARVAQLRDLGVSVQGVTVREDVAASGASLDLLPSEQRGQREAPQERMVKRVLVAAVLLLLFVALLLPVWQKRETIVALLPLLAKARQDAEGADTLARDLERLVADYNFMLARKHAPTALAYLEDVSRLLPDNTWVQQFDLRTAGKSREVQITGETASSSKLIELLEQSTLLQNATLRGTVTRGSQPGTERFMIAAETRPKSPPAMLLARDVAVAPAAAPPMAAVPLPPPPAEGTESTAAADDSAAPATAAVAEAPAATAPARPAVPAKVDPVVRQTVPPSQAKRDWMAQREARMREDQARRDALRRQAQERARARQPQLQPQPQPQPQQK